jgi:hypothetical protein
MKDKMAKAPRRPRDFQFQNPEDEFFVEFNGRPKLTVPFTRDGPRFSKKIAKAKTRHTALWTPYTWAQANEARPNTRKALIVPRRWGQFQSPQPAAVEGDSNGGGSQVCHGRVDGNYAVKRTREERKDQAFG